MDSISQKKNQIDNATSSRSQSTVEKDMNVQSLVLMCTKVAASNIGRYPSGYLRVINVDQWESIVNFRYRTTIPKQILNRSGDLNNGRTTPAICAKVLTQLENDNPHISKSDVTDLLVWKDCVNCKFKKNGPQRPMILYYPFPVHVEKLKTVGNELESIRQPPLEDTVILSSLIPNSTRRTHRMEKCLKSLSETLCLELLSKSGIGKVVKKFIKACHKICPPGVDHKKCNIPDYFPDMWSSRPLNVQPISRNYSKDTAKGNAPPLLKQLEKLLEEWKEIASKNGVVIAKSNEHGLSFSPDSGCSGRGKPTTEEQHACDVEVMLKCQQWRDLYGALVQREAKMMRCHGAKVRKLREDGQSNRSKIKKVYTKQRKRTSVSLLQDGKYMKKGANEVFGVRSSTSSASTYSQPRAGGFANAITSEARINNEKKRTTGTVLLGEGKKMMIPNKHFKLNKRLRKLREH